MEKKEDAARMPSLQGERGVPRSEVAGSLLHRVLKRRYAGSSTCWPDRVLAFLAAGGDTAVVISVLFTVDPLK